jgi:UDP-glucose 4-epimerase
VRRALVTGGAGFIGSNLVDRLIADGVEVVILDDFRTGRREFIAPALESPLAELVEADVREDRALARAIAGCDIVFHLQANADVRHGLEHPVLDLEENALATVAVLEAMRAAGTTRIVFSSTGSVYGEPRVFPTPEDSPFPLQTSLYGASKVAAEGLVSSYCHAYRFTAAIFRFVSVLGERYTHGHVIDFYRSLRANPDRLRVLGDGSQRKSYLHVGDCLEGMLSGLEQVSDGECAVFNLGHAETVIVDESVEIITRHMGVSPTIEYTGGSRGWPGDSPLIHLDCARLRATGWRPKLSIAEAISRTLMWMDDNQWAVRAPAA